MSICMHAAPRPVAFDLGLLAEYAVIRWQPRRMVRTLLVLVGRVGAVSSYSGTSWDAAHVLVRLLRRAQDGAFFFESEATR
jgi:hypothetical protein